MGNVVPEFLPGAAGAAISGLWIHDAVGLFVTPLALAIIYFVIPASTGRPIFSHFLSMLGFWLLFFLYPLNGTHHYVYSVIPMAAQLAAIATSTLLGVDVVIVVANLFLSMRGAGVLPRDPALRFVGTGTFFYVIVSLQGSAQAQMAVNQAVHFTDWVVGTLAHGDAGLCELRGRRRPRACVAADARGALQRAGDFVGLLAAGGGSGRHGRGSHRRRTRAGRPLEERRAVDRLGDGIPCLLGGARPHRHHPRGGLHRLARWTHDRAARRRHGGASGTVR